MQIEDNNRNVVTRPEVASGKDFSRFPNIETKFPGFSGFFSKKSQMKNLWKSKCFWDFQATGLFLFDFFIFGHFPLFWDFLDFPEIPGFSSQLLEKNPLNFSQWDWDFISRIGNPTKKPPLVYCTPYFFWDLKFKCFAGEFNAKSEFLNLIIWLFVLSLDACRTKWGSEYSYIQYYFEFSGHSSVKTQD